MSPFAYKFNEITKDRGYWWWSVHLDGKTQSVDIRNLSEGVEGKLLAQARQRVDLDLSAVLRAKHRRLLFDANFDGPELITANFDVDDYHKAEVEIKLACVSSVLLYGLECEIDLLRAFVWEHERRLIVES